VFENRVLWRTCGPQREEVVGGWRRLHNKELHNLYDSLIIRMTVSSRMRWLDVARVGQMKNAYKILVKKPEGKRPLGTPGYRWEDNITTDLRETGWEGVD
jgi:hypothetical protein